MLSTEILAKLSRLEITTRRKLASLYAGEHRSLQKGYGLEFDQLREYQMGDDVRFIDWSSSARSRNLMVKQYYEARSRSCIILLDYSASVFYGSGTERKIDQMVQVVAALCWAAVYSNDRVGLIVFTDTVELCIPPSSSSAHVMNVIKSLGEFTPKGTKTNVSEAFSYAARFAKEDTVFCVVSDFIDNGFDQKVKRLSHKSELVFIMCHDPYENALPSVGYIHVMDSETGAVMLVDSGCMTTTYAIRGRIQEQERFCTRSGIDLLSLVAGAPFIDELISFFVRRVNR